MYQIKKFVTSFFKVYPNRHLYLHTFLRKTPWKLYDPFITFRLQMWRMNYLHISKSFSVCLWNIFENITGMPLRGHLLAARMVYPKSLKKFSDVFSMACRQKMFSFGHFKTCMSNFADYNLIHLHKSPRKNLLVVSKNKGHTSSA